ncbi:DUF3048 domain-containing protein [Saccharopolyspora halophila]|uniref:DUF3048 domain-containing protein n=1 Tax=Saccharopolyspora halophila TaxID=405551 RepID=A0ABN3GDI9_9PSEU
MWVLRVFGTLVTMVSLVIAGALAQSTETARVPVGDPAPAPVPAPPPPPPPPGPPVLAVKIDNAPVARPPTGIGAADLIAVEPVEAGISRLIALFGSHVPPVVGPVRSARETDLSFLPQFGHPALAFSGAAPELLPMIDQAPVHDASQRTRPGAFYRGPGSAPHNMFVRTGLLPEGAGWAPGAALPFGPPPATGGVPSPHQEVSYQRTRIGFDWSPAERRWLVSFDGAPYSATDSGRLAPSTVVLQEVPITESAIADVAGNISPYAETVGSGRAVVLRDGMAYNAHWDRPAPEAGTTYTTESGEPMTFAPGQVWVVLVPEV